MKNNENMKLNWKYEAKLEIPGGRRVQTKQPSLGE